MNYSCQNAIYAETDQIVLKKPTPNFMMYGELGACPMSVYPNTHCKFLVKVGEL
jgi:hypothetical protein